MIKTFQARPPTTITCQEMEHLTASPMVIVHWTKGGTYILAELNGAISRLWYAMFQVIPYLVRFLDCLPDTSLMDEAELEDVQIHLENFPPADEPSKDMVFNE